MCIHLSEFCTYPIGHKGGQTLYLRDTLYLFGFHATELLWQVTHQMHAHPPPPPTQEKILYETLIYIYIYTYIYTYIYIYI